MRCSTNPLQLINDPIVPASRQLKPAKYLAAIVHPPNFPTKAKVQMAIVYAHVMPRIRTVSWINITVKYIGTNYSPSLSRPKSVERPDRVKYCPHLRQMRK
jgi:hypothetical protein